MSGDVPAWVIGAGGLVSTVLIAAMGWLCLWAVGMSKQLEEMRKGWQKEHDALRERVNQHRIEIAERYARSDTVAADIANAVAPIGTRLDELIGEFRAWREERRQ